MFSHKIDNKLYLKLLENNDAEDLFNLINSNRSYLKEWLSWVDNIEEVSNTRSFIEDSRKQFADNNGFQAGIWYDKDLVGVIGFHKIDWDNKKSEIGYWLGQNYQGKGIITKSCKALLDYSFKRLNLNKVEIHCAEENIKSQAIPKRLGFVKEGIIRDAQWLYDHFVSHIVYGLLASDYSCK